MIPTGRCSLRFWFTAVVLGGLALLLERLKLLRLPLKRLLLLLLPGRHLHMRSRAS
jgi:hypothetical protein